MNTPASLESFSPEPPPRSLAVPAAITLLLSLANFGLAGWTWTRVPAGARIPIHWNLAGQVDGLGSRDSLYVLPALMLGFTLLFLVLPRLDPRQGHLLRSSRAYAAIWIAFAGLMTVLNILVACAALGHPVAMEKWMLELLGLVCVVTGNFFGKIRSNFFVGIRTPWTLSSELAWNKTHRLGGWVFVGFGLLLMVAGAMQPAPRPLFVGLAVVVALMVLALATYSYFVWRNDPNRPDRPTPNS